MLRLVLLEREVNIVAERITVFPTGENTARRVLFGRATPSALDANLTGSVWHTSGRLSHIRCPLFTSTSMMLIVHRRYFLDAIRLLFLQNIWLLLKHRRGSNHFRKRRCHEARWCSMPLRHL